MLKTIRFTDFWPGFNKESNLFLDLIELQGFNFKVIENQRTYVDLEIVSLFKAEKNRIHQVAESLVKKFSTSNKLQQLSSDFDLGSKKPFQAKRALFYTGENIRPPVDERFDGFLSYDEDDFGGLNTYCPVWYLDLGTGSPRYSARVGIMIDAATLLEPRQIDFSSKSKFMCTFISNPEPNRIHALNEFRKYFEIDVYGPLAGRKVDSKIKIAKDYRYMMCFENDLYPGYVTEKPLEAYVCGTVPVYFGDLGKSGNVNSKSLINLLDFDSVKNLAQYLAKISDYEYSEIYKEPFLTRLPDFGKIGSSLVK
jgi:hypothetical protein